MPVLSTLIPTSFCGEKQQPWNREARQTQVTSAPAEVGQGLLLKETGIMEATPMPDLSGSFISSSHFSEEAEHCQREGCLRREEVVTANTISSFPARICSVSLPPKPAVGWSTGETCGHTQRWQVPHTPSSHKQEQPSYDGASLITEGQLRRTACWSHKTVPVQHLWPNSLSGMDQLSVASSHSSMSHTLPNLLSHTIPLAVWFTDMKFHTSPHLFAARSLATPLNAFHQ